MEFSFFVQEDIIFIKPVGNLLGEEEEKQMLEVLDQHLEGSVINCAVDMSLVGYISSAGISLLIQMMSHSRARQGNIVLINPCESVRKLLIITKLNTIFEIAISTQQAIEVFSENKKELSSGLL